MRCKQFLLRTSFGNLSKGQACAPLKVDILGVNQCAQCVEGFAGEEVCFRSLEWRKPGLEGRQS